MQKRFILVLILLQCLVSQSAYFANSHDTIFHLKFRYVSGNPSDTNQMSFPTRLIPVQPVKNFYVLITDAIDDVTFLVRKIKCWNYRHPPGQCTMDFESSYIFLENLGFSTDHVLQIVNKQRLFKEFLRNISRTPFNASGFNLTYTIVGRYPDHPDKPYDPSEYPLSKTNLFGIIFLGICVALVLLLCFGWFFVIYYRQFRQYRIKKKLRKALAQTTELMLSKSLVIIFDPNHRDSDQVDDDPTCAICLESFKTNEKLRKLVCSHYFHVICIDPWLLSHQNCPLCNRNILRQSIPSISSSIMAAVNERNNDETTSIAINENNQT